MKNTALILSTIYLSLAPIDWWPGFSFRHFNLIKYPLFISSILAVQLFTIGKRRVTLPGGLTGNTGLALITVASITGMLQADFYSSLRHFLCILFSFLTLWTFYGLSKKIRHESLMNLFTWASVIIGIHAIPVVTSKFLGIPNISGPAEHLENLWNGGFSAQRVGWSGGVALFIPFLLAYLLRKDQTILKRITLVILSVFIILSQFAVAGRSGLVATFVGCLWLFSMKGGKRYLLISFLLLVSITYFNSNAILENLRLSSLSGSFNVNNMNELSTGRVSGYLLGLEAFFANPLFGYGFNNFNAATYSGPSHSQIHNLWLRLAVESGVLLPLFVFLFVVELLIRSSTVSANNGKNNKTSQRNIDHRVMQSVLFVGLTITMFEPTTIIGVFQRTVVWWAVAGAIVGKYEVR